MKIKYIMVLFFVFVLGLTTFSYAQDHRGGHDRSQERVQNMESRINAAHDKIDRGIQSGALTREEAHRLKGELNAVRDDEARMRADGRLSRDERDRLERELDRLERHISRLKHNDNSREREHRR